MLTSWRDLCLIVFCAAGAFGASGAYAAVAALGPATLLDLPWLSIVGGVGLSMAGGLVSTLSAMHAAAEGGREIRVALRLGRDLGLAAVVGCAAYAYAEVESLGPFVLLGIAPIAGYAAAKILEALVALMTRRVSGG